MIQGGLFDEGGSVDLSAAGGQTGVGLDKGDVFNMPLVDKATPFWDAPKQKISQFNKYGMEYSQKSGDPNVKEGFYYTPDGQVRASEGGDIYQNLNLPDQTVASGSKYTWTKRDDPLARAGNFGDVDPGIKIPGIGTEDFAGQSKGNRLLLLSSLYNPDVASRINESAKNNPQFASLNAKQKAAFTAMGRGENPDFTTAFTPKLTFGTPYSEGNKGYVRGGYNYGGFKDFGDASTWADEYKKNKGDSGTGIRDKFLNTPEYYTDLASGKGFKPFESVYKPPMPKSRGGSQGSPDRLEQLGNYTNWSGAVPKSWEKKVKDTWRDFASIF